MKIGVISDTHDNTRAVVWIIEFLNQHSINTSFHAGDLISPGIIRRFKSHYQGHLHFVFGNNDGELSAISSIAKNSAKLTCHNREMYLNLEEKDIFMNHYAKLVERIAQSSNDFDLCIGGHEHIFETKTFDKTLFINPGHTMVMDRWQRDIENQNPPSFVILDLKNLKSEKILLPDL